MWHQEKFKSFEEAAQYQRLKVMEAFGRGAAIRECGMADETDFDTKIHWWLAWVRTFETHIGELRILDILGGPDE